MLGIINRHRTVFLVAVFISLIYGSHHFWTHQILENEGKTYYPITAESNFDVAVTSVPRAQAVFSEDPIIGGDISLAERKHTPGFLPILNPLISGWLAKLTGSIHKAFIAIDFLFPALTFVVIYFLLFEFTMNKPLSLFASTVFLFIPQIILHIPPLSFEDLEQIFFHSVHLFYNPEPGDLYYFSRLESPELTYFFFALATLLTIRALMRNRWSATLLAGLSFGVLFYTYFYDWVYFAVGLGLMFLVFLFRREYKCLARIIVIGATGLFVSIPYWVNFFKLQNLPQYADISARIGLDVGRTLNTEYWFLYLHATLLISLVWFFMRKDVISTYLVSFVLAIFVVLNIQLVVGFNPQPGHWLRPYLLGAFGAVSILLYWFYDRFGKHLFSPAFATKIGIVLLFFIIPIQFYSQYVYSELNAEAHTIDARYENMYQWLEGHASPGSIIISLSPITNAEILTYTRHKVFVPDGFITTASNEEIWNRFMVASRLYGVSLGQFGELLSSGSHSNEARMTFYLFHFAYRDFSYRDVFIKIPGDVYNEKIGAYHNLLLNERVELPYRVDYIFMGPREREITKIQDIATHEPLERVYEEKGIVLYKVKDF